MEHILSLSYGKDSLACLAAIEQLGWPLDRIVHAEVWATDEIPADLPPMVEFKAKADAIIKARWGIEVEHLCAMKNGEKLTYEKLFYHVPKRKPGGKFSGDTVAGYPYQKGAWCQDRLKGNVLDAISTHGGGLKKHVFTRLPGARSEEKYRAVFRHRSRRAGADRATPKTGIQAAPGGSRVDRSNVQGLVREKRSSVADLHGFCKGRLLVLPQPRCRAASTFAEELPGTMGFADEMGSGQPRLV